MRKRENSMDQITDQLACLITNKLYADLALTDLTFVTTDDVNKRYIFALNDVLLHVPQSLITKIIDGK
jgi:hypothetical protein